MEQLTEQSRAGQGKKRQGRGEEGKELSRIRERRQSHGRDEITDIAECVSAYGSGSAMHGCVLMLFYLALCITARLHCIPYCTSIQNVQRTVLDIIT